MYKPVFDELKFLFESNKDLGQATSMKKYMKGKFEFLGIKSPLRKKLNSSVYKKYKIKPNDDFRDLINKLWNEEEREFQYTAMDWMERVVNKMDKEWIGVLEQLVTNKSWWDTVDWIASNGIGRLFLKFPETRKLKCDNWIQSDNMWLNRTALLHQLKHREKTNFDLLQSYILSHKDSKEFFINKASGWALRQHYKYKPLEVFNFVSQHPELSNLTKREA